MSRARKFLRLEGGDRRLLVRSAWLLAAIRIGLWIMPVRRLRRIAAGGRRARTCSAYRPSAARIAWAIQTAARYVPGATCLPQALAAEVVLRRHAYPARLRIGVAPADSGRVTGHAWVESSDGLVIGGAEEYRDAQLQIVAGESR